MKENEKKCPRQTCHLNINHMIIVLLRKVGRVATDGRDSMFQSLFPFDVIVDWTAKYCLVTSSCCSIMVEGHIVMRIQVQPRRRDHSLTSQDASVQ